MALKPTIYKLTIALSDMDRNYYDQLQLTVAQHPSETLERMMVRVLAFCLNADERLLFTAGISAPDEADIWLRSDNGEIALWIDVGEPSIERIKKGARAARNYKVYSYNTKSDLWWSNLQAETSRLHLSVFQFRWADIQAVAKLVERTMTMSVTISGESAFVASGRGEIEVIWKELTSA